MYENSGIVLLFGCHSWKRGIIPTNYAHNLSLKNMLNLMIQNDSFWEPLKTSPPPSPLRHSYNNQLSKTSWE